MAEAHDVTSQADPHEDAGKLLNLVTQSHKTECEPLIIVEQLVALISEEWGHLLTW